MERELAFEDEEGAHSEGGGGRIAWKSPEKQTQRERREKDLSGARVFFSKKVYIYIYLSGWVGFFGQIFNQTAN